MEEYLPTGLFQDDYRDLRCSERSAWQNYVALFEHSQFDGDDYALPFDLYTAVEKGECKYVEELIRKNNLDVNIKNKEGWTALMYAAHCGKPNAVDILLKYGANVHARDKKGRNALMYAILGRGASCIDSLVQAGCILETRDNNDWTAIFHAVVFYNYAACETLLAFGANPNACVAVSFETPLMFAAHAGDLRMTALLLSARGNPYIQTNKGKSALDFAAEGNFADVLALLKQPKAEVVISCNPNEQKIYDAKQTHENETENKLEELLSKLGLSVYYAIFQKEGVDYQTFLSLTDQDLKQCGVVKLGPRRKMLEAINRWHNHAPMRSGLEAAYANKLEVELSEIKSCLHQKLEPLRLENEMLNSKLRESYEIGKLISEKACHAYHLSSTNAAPPLLQDTILTICNFLKNLLDVYKTFSVNAQS